MSKTDKKFEMELNIMKYRIHANSPYNNGWTQDTYKKLYEQEIKKLKKYEQNRSKQTSNK